MSAAEQPAPTTTDTLLVKRLREAEAALDVRRPERSKVPVQVLGYGEMSGVLWFVDDPVLDRWVFKRLPIFHDAAEAEAYERLCANYVQIIRDQIGLRMPSTSFLSMESRPGLVVFYAVQERLPTASIGSNVIREASEAVAAGFLERVLAEAGRVWDFNRTNGQGIELALDMQLSNWAEPVTPAPDSRPLYIDITTPLMRIDGREQLSPKLLLRGCPPLLRWPVERFLADGVVSRYYDHRQVVIDVLANCIKEGCEDLLPVFLDVVNPFFARRPAGGQVAPIRMEEVYRYYRSDAGIWMMYLGLKKVDRFLKTRLLGRPYDFVLSERIERNFPLRNHPKARRGGRRG